MNTKRRAELQRKLSLKAVPRPPAGLSDRIKADIPKYLEVEAERSRFSGAVAFNMRVAASVLLAVMTLVVTVYVVNSPNQEKQAAIATPGPFPPARVLAQPQAAPTTSAEGVRLDSAREASVPVPIAAMTPPPALPARSSEPLDARERQQSGDFAPEETAQQGIAGRVMGEVAGGVEGGVASMADRAEPQDFLAERDASAAPMPAAAPPPPPVAGAEALRVRTERAAPAAALAQTARNATAKTIATTPDEVFGISVDPQNFYRIQQTLESGGRPVPSAVNIEALVNYFAGPAERLPRRGVSLDVEASPAAIEAEGDHAVLRFSIDTPAGAGGPIASDVRLEILFNSQAVASAKRVGGDEPLPAESLLGYGTSVTGLYALELRPNLHASQRIATVRLHYKSIANGKPETLTEHVHGRDLAKSWRLASRRHRLASLGALWGERLKTGEMRGTDIARRAEELATQDPKDARARELAAAASASADGSR
jgi:hypothetical protein